MTDENIVAVFANASDAQAAVASLKTAGVPTSAISMHANSAGVASGATTVAPVREEGFWSSLFGDASHHETAVYERSLASGSTVVSVKTPENFTARVLEILESHNPEDLDEGGATYGLNPGTIAGTAAAMPEAAPVSAMQTGRTEDNGKLQLSEEALAIGKRVVNRGGTRIRRYVVETPVEENVSLHSERVVLERHPVTDGRVPTDSFSDKTLEMTETAEEAVITKTASVYEEVGLRKEVSDRVETVRDTVRKEEVEVVQVPGAATTGTVAPVITKTVTTEDKLSPKL